MPDTDGDGCNDGLDLFPERLENYRAGLGTFTLKRATNANLRVFTLAANFDSFTPFGGPMQVESGKPVDLGPLQAPPGRSDDCSYAPYNPWVMVEVQALDIQSARTIALDLTSQTPAPKEAGQAARFYWNVREDLLSWDASGASAWPLSAGIQLEGADARLVLRPAVT